MANDIANITQSDERAKVKQESDRAAPPPPDKPKFIEIAPFSGSHEATRSFVARRVPRDKKNLRDFVKTVGTRLTIPELEGIPAKDGGGPAIDLEMEGLSSEWIAHLRRKLPELARRLARIDEMKRFKRDMGRRPELRRQVAGFIKGLPSVKSR